VRFSSLHCAPGFRPGLVGERRIRVVTLALPTSSNLQEIYQGVDQVAVAHYLSAKAVERVVASSATLEAARDGVAKTLTDILGAYRTTITGSGPGTGGLVVGESLRGLPVLALALIKNVALRQNAGIPIDMRAYAMALLTSLTPQLLVPYLCPNFYSLHDMQEEVSASLSCSVREAVRVLMHLVVVWHRR
jgi:protein transport protein SEC24